MNANDDDDEEFTKMIKFSKSGPGIGWASELLIIIIYKFKVTVCDFKIYKF